MNTFRSSYTGGEWTTALQTLPKAQLVLSFGNHKLATDPDIQQQLRSRYPEAEIVGCTTSGEIGTDSISDDTLDITAIELQHSCIKVCSASVEDQPEIETAKTLCQQLKLEGLKNVMVFIAGLTINGSALISAINKYLPDDVVVTGGLAGDGTRFGESHAWHNTVSSGTHVVVCGFYGDRLGVRTASQGGWVPFGPARAITKSEGNVLWSLDNKPALELYKKYLGDECKNLPASALLFPLQINTGDDQPTQIRTILSISETNNSMTFAGEIPADATAALTHSSVHRLIDAAESAAELAFDGIETKVGDGLVMMVSCVGRRMVLKQHSEEEVEAVTGVFNDNWTACGFYSYGEIGPQFPYKESVIHNQTMTITAIYEY